MALHAPEDAKKLKKAVTKAINQGKPYEIDLKLNLPSGKNAYHHAIGKPVKNKDGKVIKILGTVQDVTKRKKIEEKIERIFRMSTDLVCEANLNTATFLKINPAFEKILGYTKKELLEKPFFEFIHPEDIARTEIIIDSELKKGKDVISFINRYKCKNGSYKWLEWNSKPDLKEGKIYAIARDITERKKQEQILKKQMMKYNLLEGNIYLEKEKTQNKSIKAFNDLLDLDYKGLVFSRELKKGFLNNIKNEFDYYWFAEKKIKNSIKPNIKNILSKIEKLDNKTVIFIDRLDYIISKNKFEKTLDLIHQLRENAVLKKLIVIISLD